MMDSTLWAWGISSMTYPNHKPAKACGFLFCAIE